MKSSWHLRLLPQDDYQPATHPSGGVPGNRSASLRKAILRTREHLLGAQQADGYWVGELEGDTILESEYILLLAFLGEGQSQQARMAARYLLAQQLDDGGWAMYPGGPLEISGSVKAYFALKIVGHDPSEECMQKARTAILAHGGADAVNTFTRYYLALLGQISYDQCPVVPPEFLLLPQWFPINLTRVSAWSRTMIVPLSIMSSLKPVTPIEPSRGIRELFLQTPDKWEWPKCPGLAEGQGWFNWRSFFLGVNSVLQTLEKYRLLPCRKMSLKKAEQWMLDRFEQSEGLGAIFPPMVWSIIALKALGYTNDNPVMARCRKVLDDLALVDGDTMRLQPCKSPVWDTAISLIALADCGVAPEHAAIEKAHEWLLAKQTKASGDWSATVDCEPGGWYFEHENEFYPDVDDTAMVLMALGRRFDKTQVKSDELPSDYKLMAPPQGDDEDEDRCERRDREISRSLALGESWILSMQNRDGGWGAFDRDNDCEFLCHLPFADHNAMIDPSTPDLTARVLEALGQRGHRQGHSAIDRAVAYLRQTQEADGSWFGRWGVNYIYGTWQGLVGLAAVGVPTSDPMIQAAAHWLLAHQQASGGWGESCDTYADPSLRGQGNPTPSQTAWALMGLLAAGMHGHAAVSRGIDWLIDQQHDDGTWEEPEFTGTGFPQVFYLRYHMYRIYFPLMALSRYTAARASGPGERTRPALHVADFAMME